MWNKVLTAAAVAFGTALAAALGIDIYEHHKVAKKIGISVNELAKVSQDTIKESLVERAVESAAEKNVETYISRVKNDVMAEARDKIGAEVRKAVNDASGEIKEKVAAKITEEVSKIDISDMKKSVREKAEERVLSKFITF